MNRQQLEEKKRALVAESEAYRQTLQLELAQLQLHAEHLKRRFRYILLAQPFLALFPLLIKLVAGRKSSIERNSRSRLGGVINAALLGWRMARRFAPLFSALHRRASRRRFSSEEKSHS